MKTELENILGKEIYRKTKINMKARINEVKAEGNELAEIKKKSKVMMNYLNRIYHDKLTQDYIHVNYQKKLTIDTFTDQIVFDIEGIFILGRKLKKEGYFESVGLSYFNGQDIVNPSIKSEYLYGNLISAEPEEFKARVSREIRKKFREFYKGRTRGMTK